MGRGRRPLRSGLEPTAGVRRSDPRCQLPLPGLARTAASFDAGSTWGQRRECPPRSGPRRHTPLAARVCGVCRGLGNRTAACRRRCLQRRAPVLRTHAFRLLFFQLISCFFLSFSFIFFRSPLVTCSAQGANGNRTRSLDGNAYPRAASDARGQQLGLEGRASCPPAGSAFSSAPDLFRSRFLWGLQKFPAPRPLVL